ncbi:MAG TPA: ankyrin repeat domain-containing protein [Tepidisphaeraceae bacterium]|jgi:hypothetical protein|nr:ankyrin repeat domain-containing protein [Tepidisphaeraceae bacterium]
MIRRMTLLLLLLMTPGAQGVEIGPAKQADDPWAKYDVLTTSNAAKEDRFEKVVEKELGEYTPVFIGNSGLKHIWSVRHLTVEKQPRGAVVLQSGDTLVIDIDTPEDRRYLRHAIHHEFYHLIEFNLAGDFYFRDPKWMVMNPPDFKYGEGGRFDQDSATDPGNIVHPLAGFVDQYATSGLEEDKAEIFACLMVPEEAGEIEQWSRADRVLEAKVKYMRGFVEWWSKDTGPMRELFLAVVHDDEPAVEKLLAAEPALATREAWGGWKPMHWAAAHASAGALSALAKRVGANDVDDQGWTALHIAAVIGDETTCRQLLGLGANVGARDKSGKTAGDYAKLMHHDAIAALLLKY